MTTARPFTQWVLAPPGDPNRQVNYVLERPTGASMLERLRKQAEIPSVGMGLFSGTFKQRKTSWLLYRSFLRQGISNFDVALAVENRSASLLYYYAMLNFAKAELLVSGTAAVRGFVQHGLQLNVTKAKTIAGDFLTVSDGVFQLLYESRTGFKLPVGTRLPIKRLLAHLPEIGEQLPILNKWESESAGILHLVALDGSQAWVLLALVHTRPLDLKTASGRYLTRTFREVDPPEEWKDRFGVSRRVGRMVFYESRDAIPFTVGDETSKTNAYVQARAITWRIKDLLGLTTSGGYDAWLTPSLYKSRMLPMPPSLARYATAFYASSLVRYRPQMIDPELFPEQAYVFDAVARECAIPILTDTLSGLTGADFIFHAEDAFRV